MKQTHKFKIFIFHLTNNKLTEPSIAKNITHFSKITGRTNKGADAPVCIGHKGYER